MEQIYTSTMAMIHTDRAADKPAAKSTGPEKTSFRDLLAKQRTAEDRLPVKEEGASEPKKPCFAETQTEQETQPEEQQLLASALFMGYRPMIPVEQVNVQTQLKTTVSPADTLLSAGEAGAQMIQKQLSMQEAAQNQPAAVKAQGGDLLEHSAVVTQGAEELSVAPAQSKQGLPAQVEDATNSETDMSGTESLVFRDAEKVLVRVGDAAGTENAAEAGAPVKDQIGEQVSRALDRGEMKLTVRLNPESLGQVDVELTMTENGTLRIELRAENQQTQRLLERESTGLQQLLMRHTQQEIQIQVSREYEGQQQSFDDGRQNQNHQNPQRERREERRNAGDFLQQLRLGLISLGVEAS